MYDFLCQKRDRERKKQQLHEQEKELLFCMLNGENVDNKTTENG